MKRKMFMLTMCMGLTLVMAAPAVGDYAEVVAADSPVAWWRLNETGGTTVANSGSAPGFAGTVMLNTNLNVVGPAESAAGFSYDGEVEMHGDYIEVLDGGGPDPLDFALGDSITIEAWVDIQELSSPIIERDAQHVLSKGRLADAAGTDMEYCLRVTNWGTSLPLRVDFLGRSADGNWHKWRSNAGFAVDSGWHHVALTYTFGNGGSMTGYIDGVGDSGTWTRGTGSYTPYQGNKNIWLGSAQAGWDYATIHGSLDEVAVYRTALSAERILAHFEAVEELPSYAPGDANRDGKVDETDAAILAENWLADEATWSKGDFNKDGTVDDKDAAMMAANWQRGVSPAVAVPEPGVVALMLGLLAGACSLVRRRGV